MTVDMWAQAPVVPPPMLPAAATAAPAIVDLQANPLLLTPAQEPQNTGKPDMWTPVALHPAVCVR